MVITIASAAFIAVLIVVVVWLVRRHSDRPKPSNLGGIDSLLKYTSLVGIFSDNLGAATVFTAGFGQTDPFTAL